jgi:hypothetical protein
MPLVSALAELQRPLEGHVGRPATAKQQRVEQRAPGVIEHNQLAVEYVVLRQEIKHLLEALHPVAVARGQLAANGVSGSAESVELDLKQANRDGRTAPLARRD